MSSNNRMIFVIDIMVCFLCGRKLNLNYTCMNYRVFEKMQTYNEPSGKQSYARYKSANIPVTRVSSFYR